MPEGDRAELETDLRYYQSKIDLCFGNMPTDKAERATERARATKDQLELLAQLEAGG